VRVTGRPIRFLAGVAVAFTVVIGAPAAFGVGSPSQFPVVDPGVPPADAGVAPAPVAPAPAAASPVATTPPAAAAPGTTGSLARGSGGADVKALQRKLRVRGIRVPVDGAYGRQTRAGVRILQRKLHLRATGVADAKLLSRLGLKIRAVASAPAAPATAQYLKAFPVSGTHSFEDDFGAARHQGSHEGNDIMSPRGTPVVAVADGTIKRLTRVETGLGGIWIWLVDTAGNEYYYAHLTDIVAGLDAGSKVTAGQQIGTVGNTGDARSGDCHLHFEVHPGGGGAVDPYTDLVAVDPNHGKN